MTEKKHLKISVLIATYNRRESLEELLHLLLKQEYDESLDYEVIIADNNSKDSTKQMVSSLQEVFAGRLKYCFESRQYKTHALNKGLRLCTGDLVAAIDDDCLVTADWLQNIKQVFTEHDIDLLAGKIIPKTDKPIPDWIDLEVFKGQIGYFDLGDSYIENDKIQILAFGAHMILKRSSFEKYGDYKILGPTEDTELCYRWHQQGAVIAFSPTVVLEHKTPKYHFTKKYMRQGFYRWGIKSVSIFNDKYSNCRMLFGVPLWFYRKLLERLGTYLKSFFLFSEKKNFIAEVWLRHYWGIFIGLLQREKVSHNS